MSEAWHCPVCNNRINAGFGMVQCSQCQTVLFIDFAGNIVVGGGDNEAHASDLGSNVDFRNDDIELGKGDYSQVFSGEVEAEDIFAPPNGEQGWEQRENETSQEIVGDFTDNSELDAESLNQDHANNITSQAEVFDSSKLPQLDTFQEQTTEAPPALEGGEIFYQIMIEGIDSSQLRKNILESLRDSRLGLVNDEISEAIKGGMLIIRGLNAVKASFIINSLKDLPIELNWQMYAEDAK